MRQSLDKLQVVSNYSFHSEGLGAPPGLDANLESAQGLQRPFVVAKMGKLRRRLHSYPCS
jgi:hypothetical protein